MKTNHLIAVMIALLVLFGATVISNLHKRASCIDHPATKACSSLYGVKF